MRQLIDPDKIETTQDILDLVRFVLTNSNLVVEKDKVIGYDKIERLLREANNGTGN